MLEGGNGPSFSFPFAHLESHSSHENLEWNVLGHKGHTNIFKICHMESIAQGLGPSGELTGLLAVCSQVGEPGGLLLLGRPHQGRPEDLRTGSWHLAVCFICTQSPVPACVATGSHPPSTCSAPYGFCLKNTMPFFCGPSYYQDFCSSPTPQILEL
jgi:hypothetical protein